MRWFYMSSSRRVGSGVRVRVQGTQRGGGREGKAISLGNGLMVASDQPPSRTLEPRPPAVLYHTTGPGLLVLVGWLSRGRLSFP